MENNDEIKTVQLQILYHHYKNYFVDY